ncbi:MAG: hypothetical protein V5A47_12570 [Bacteroidales bacterium]
MIIKVLIVSAILVAFIMLPYLIHLLFEKDSEFSLHECPFDEDWKKKAKGCSSCQLKELVDCPENNEGYKRKNYLYNQQK